MFILVALIGFGISANAQTTCTIYDKYDNVLGEIAVSTQKDRQGYYCLVYTNTSEKTVTISVTIRGTRDSDDYCTQTVICSPESYNQNVGRLQCYSVNPYYQTPVLEIPNSKRM
jgi:hypothetical protein